MDLLERIDSRTARVTVIGLGYIGIPTAVCAAEAGYTVHGVDVKQDTVKRIKSGAVTVKEPGLRDLLEKNIQNGKIEASLSYKESDIFIICVPTPLREKKADLSHVKSAGISIASVLKKGNLIILESTVPPGTTEELLIPLLESSGLKNNDDFFVTFCPERVLPGKIMTEMSKNDRIAGGSATSRKLAAAFYRSFVDGELYLTDIKTAEMVKLMENTFRNVNIALANELALACERVGINFFEARTLANKHPRVNLHEAGTGVGGHCIPIDPWFVHEKVPMKMITTAMKINSAMLSHIVDILKQEQVTSVLILGMAYKKNTEDTRESPTAKIIALLEKEQIAYSVYDPYLDSSDLSSAGHDALLIATDHDCFRNLPWKSIAAVMKRPLMIDGRNFFTEREAEALGFEYRGVGK
jgi:UDP-N-acetyl-D-mannosaminuronic acid dehydrogenase